VQISLETIFFKRTWF